jgi:cytoskeletal protein RodZ
MSFVVTLLVLILIATAAFGAVWWLMQRFSRHRGSAPDSAAPVSPAVTPSPAPDGPPASADEPASAAEPPANADEPAGAAEPPASADEPANAAEPVGEVETRQSAVATVATGPYGPDSAAPLADGSAPDGFTVKGKTGSMLFHAPGSPYYKRTKPDVWFRTPEAAEAAGFSHWQSRRKQK